MTNSQKTNKPILIKQLARRIRLLAWPRYNDDGSIQYFSYVLDKGQVKKSKDENGNIVIHKGEYENYSIYLTTYELKDLFGEVPEVKEHLEMYPSS